MLTKVNDPNSHVRGGFSKNIGDFSKTLFDVLVKRHTGKVVSNITVGDVNKKLDELSLVYSGVAKDKLQQQEAIIKYFFLHCSPKEVKWIVRIILKDLKVGMSADSILKCYHPSGKILYGFRNNLKTVAEELQDINYVMEEKIDVQLNESFTPMLSQLVGDLDKIVNIMGNKDFFVEEKLDGERVLLHKDGENYRYFSRNGNELTESYGATPNTGSLTPLIHNRFKSGVKKCILDGEMLSYDSDSQVLLPFGHLKSARKESNGTKRPIFVFFDCLFIEANTGRSQLLTKTALSERKRVCESIIHQKKSTDDDLYKESLILVPYKIGKTVGDLIKFLDESLLLKQEGLIIKKPESHYSATSRTDDWIKLKPEYVGGLSDTLDCVIVGGQWGVGRRGGTLSSLILAVLKDKSDLDNPQFMSFTKVSVGKQENINKLFDDITKWKDYDPKKGSPSWLLHPLNANFRPDKIINPRDSFVLAVKGSEFIRNDNFTGYTLRFPRIDCIRNDKTWKDILTFDELKNMIALNAGRMYTKTAKDAYTEDKKVKKKRKIATSRTQVKVSANDLGLITDNLTQTSDLFAGKVFYVIFGVDEISLENSEKLNGIGLTFPDDASTSKQKIEYLVVKNGGNIVQNPVGDCLVIADKDQIKVTNLKKTGKYDILKSKWIIDCVISSSLVSLCHRYALYATAELEKKFSLVSDEFGDVYTEQLDEETFKQILSSMDVDKIQKRFREEESNDIVPFNRRIRMKTEIEERYSIMDNPSSELANMVVFVDEGGDIMVSLDLEIDDFTGLPIAVGKKEEKLDGVVALSIRVLGGRVVNCWSSSTTHIVTKRPEVFDRVLLHVPGRFRNRPQIVGEGFVDNYLL